MKQINDNNKMHTRTRKRMTNK